MQLLEATFQPIVMIFAVANLFAMGLQTRLPALMAALKNTLGMALIFVWGWVLGPVIGYVITRVIPLAEPYVIVILLSSVAPCSPFFPTMVERARGDVGFIADDWLQQREDIARIIFQVGILNHDHGSRCCRNWGNRAVLHWSI